MDIPPERTSRRIRAERVGRRPAGFRAVLMAAALVFALAYVFFLRTPPQVPVPNLPGVAGAYIWTGKTRSPDGSTRTTTETGSFSAVASGNAGGMAKVTHDPGMFDGAPSAIDSAYDAGPRRETSRSLRNTWWYETTTGAWPPVWRVETHTPVSYMGLAAVVRSALEDNDHSIGIKPLKDGERKVWRAVMTFGDSAVEIVVDQQTGLVTWCTETTPSAVATFTAEPAWTDPPPANETYRLGPEKPAGLSRSSRTSKDTTYTYVSTLAAAAATVGFTPLESTLEPDGYALRAVAVGRPYQAPLELLADKVSFHPGLPSPKRDNEIAQLYTRDLTWFSLQTVAARASPRFAALTRQAVSAYAERGLSARTEVLQYGAFAGATAHTWYAEDGPTLFVANAEYAVVARGGLTRQELITLAEGLQPLDSGASASPSPSP